MHRRSARARRIYACSSSRKKRPHRSALCIRRRPCRWVSGRLNVLMFGVARKLTLRALGGSNTPSRRSRRSARARRIYACSSSRKKRPHRSALCTAAVRLSHFSALGFFVGPKPALNVIKWSLINTPFEHVYVTGSQPDLLTSSHSRLPGAGRSNHKSTHTRVRASPRPPPSTTSLVPPIATASGHAPPSLPPGSYPRDEARSHRSHTPFLPSSLSTLLLRREAAAAAA